MFGQNLIHANFSVNDLATAKAFYCDTLGFEVVKSFGGQLVLGAGGNTKVVIYEKEDHTPWNATVLGIEVSSVGDAVTQLEAKGIKMENVEGTDESGIFRDAEMGEAAWFRDPAGNWICINSLA